MTSPARCPRTDLYVDQCACDTHRKGWRSVEQITDLGRGYSDPRRAAPIELAACGDEIVARWPALQAGTCGRLGCPIRAGDVVGRDTDGTLICGSCLPDRGAYGDRAPKSDDEPDRSRPVPIPDLIEATTYGRATYR